MTGGTGADVFLFTKGQAGGVDIILDFTNSDRISLKGYGTLATQSALNSAQISGGSTSIVLPDSTTVTLLNFTGLTGSNFA
jgi:hypothetical protein